MRTSLMFYGGIPDRKNNWHYWIESIRNSPSLFSTTLKPISDLIGDSNKRQSMMLAVKAHLDKAVLNDLKTQLESFATRTLVDNLLTQV